MIVIISVFVGLNWYKTNLEPVSSSMDEIIITVPIGSTAPEIGNILEVKGLIKSSFSFEIYVRLNDYRNKLQAGGYKFMPSQSVQEIVRHLVDGDVATDLLTILPAQRIDQIKLLFVKAGYDPTVVNEALKPENYQNHPALKGKPVSASLEGYLYPDSYQITSTTTVKQLIAASLDEMALALTPDLQKKFEAQGLSNYQAITIASIVEKEVSNPDDRPVVAQVFLKRYREGIMLGSDVTAFYGADVAGLEQSVFADTPYNTRIYTGLPPGPISNVSKGSLEAVANPAQTDYLFFVAGDDGITYFSKTLAEHEALTAKHCIELCR